MRKSELPKILIVDDLQENRLALEALLESLPTQILCAESGADALDLLLEHDVALALLDVQMPGMNGFELAELMRGAARTKDVPIVFVTAGAPDSSWQFRGYDAGAVDFLFKPLDSRIVLSKVKILLAIFQHKNELEAQVRAAESARDRAERLAEKLEAETVLRDRFVAALSHDLRVPLTAARLAGQMIEHLKEPTPEAVARYSRKLVQSIDRADRMITDLLDVSRIEAGKPIPLVLTKTDVNAVFQRLAEELSVIFGPRLRIRSEVVSVAWWNDDAIRRLLENLVSNAAKYGSADQPITVLAREHSEGVQVTVHNFGNPIPPGEQKALFQRFHRSGEAEQSGKKGWGIGLAICRGLASSLGGKLGLTSDSVEGTTFTIELPLDPRPAQDRQPAISLA